MQAAAAGVEAEAAMNPVLLKPGDDRHSQVVLLGRPVADVDAMSYRDLKPTLMSAVAGGVRRSAQRASTWSSARAPEARRRSTCATATSPTWGWRERFDLPTIVVGDIDRGGVFASMFGTLAVLSPEDQALIAGFVVNKFRGDERLVAPALELLRGSTGRPTSACCPGCPGCGWTWRTRWT